MNLNILVTAVGGDIGQNVIKCLKESGHLWHLYGCDMDKYAGGRKLVERFKQVPRATHSEYLSVIGEMIKEYEIDYVIPIAEPEIAVFNKNRQYNALINNEFILDRFLDKYKTIQFFKENNFLYPETYLMKDYEGQLGFPVFLKARQSRSGVGRVKVNDLSDLDYYRLRMPDCIVQKYIGNEDAEYTVGVFSDRKQTYYIVFRRYLGYGSLSRFVELCYFPELDSIIQRISDNCQLDGSINIQFRKTEEGFIPFEINPRISSSVYFRHYFGFDDVVWWLYSKTGQEFTYVRRIGRETVNEYHHKGIGVRTVGEVFFEG